MFRTRPGGSQGSQKFRYSYLSGLVQDFDIDMTRIEKVTATVVPAPINFSRPLAIWPRRFRNFLTRTDVCLTHLHEVLRQGWGGPWWASAPGSVAVVCFSSFARAKMCQVPAQILRCQSHCLLVPVTSTTSGVSPKMTG